MEAFPWGWSLTAPVVRPGGLRLVGVSPGDLEYL